MSARAKEEKGVRDDDDEEEDTDGEEDDALKRGILFRKKGLHGVTDTEGDAEGGAEGGVGSMEHVTW